jgi:NAD(P)-dependent dehydrogenase (short-subunit alcohol dehydrogenase family)
MIQAVMPYMRAQGEPTLVEAEAFLKDMGVDPDSAAATAADFTTGATPEGHAGRSPKKGGYIINLSSTSGLRGMPGFEFYVASKFALEGMMDSFRYTAAGLYRCVVWCVNVYVAADFSFITVPVLIIVLRLWY